MVRPNITNSVSFQRRPCMVCANRDWEVNGYGVDSFNDRKYTILYCKSCGAMFKVGEPMDSDDSKK